MSKLVSQSAYAQLDQQTLTVGTSEAVLPAPNTARVKNPEQIYLQAASTNTVNIVVGRTGVLSNLTNGGFELQPGDNMILPINLRSLLYAIAGSASQKLLVSYVQSPN